MNIAKEVLVHRKEGTIILENIGDNKVRFVQNRKKVATIPLFSAVALCHDLFSKGWRLS